MTVGEGVVVKFGSTQNSLCAIGSTVETRPLRRERDSSIGGQIRSGLPAPSAGAWRGIKLEKSSGEFLLTLGDPLIRYAGSDNAAALSIRGFSPNLSFLRVRDSTVGVRLLDGANARLTGFLIKGNATGVEADGDSAAQILQSTFESNTSGVVNRTPSTVIQATGNWWGHASGPRDPAGNPQGQGDSVSSGVNYGSYLASAPLTNPTLRIAEPRPFFDQSLIALLLSCVNATEYRVAENGAFGGVGFVPLVDGRASVQLPLSAGDGVKPISAQFRDVAGNIVTANLGGWGAC